MRITYSIQYHKKLLARMNFGYCLYFYKRSFIESLIIVALLLLCYPNRLDPDFLGVFLAAGVVYGWLDRIWWTVLRSLGDGFRDIGKYHDKKVDFALTDESIIQTSKLAKMEYSWDTLIHIVDMKSYLLLVLRNHGFVPVPKEVLTPEDNAWLDGKVPRKKTKSGRVAAEPAAMQPKDVGESQLRKQPRADVGETYIGPRG